jgi:hypothetical protein
MVKLLQKEQTKIKRKIDLTFQMFFFNKKQTQHASRTNRQNGKRT